MPRWLLTIFSALLLSGIAPSAFALSTEAAESDERNCQTAVLEIWHPAGASQDDSSRSASTDPAAADIALDMPEVFFSPEAGLWPRVSASAPPRSHPSAFLNAFHEGLQRPPRAFPAST